MEERINFKIFVSLFFFLFFISTISAWNFENTNDDFNFIEKDVVLTQSDFVKYIGVWGMDVGDIILDQNVYANVTNITQGETYGFLFQNGTITTQTRGVYHIMSQWSFSGGANTEYHISLSHNGVSQDNCHAERVIGSGGDVGSSSYTCILRLEVGDYVIPIAENVDSGVDTTIHDFQLNLIKVGN